MGATECERDRCLKAGCSCMKLTQAKMPSNHPRSCSCLVEIPKAFRRELAGSSTSDSDDTLATLERRTTSGGYRAHATLLATETTVCCEHVRCRQDGVVAQQDRPSLPLGDSARHTAWESGLCAAEHLLGLGFGTAECDAPQGSVPADSAKNAKTPRQCANARVSREIQHRKLPRLIQDGMPPPLLDSCQAVFYESTQGYTVSAGGGDRDSVCSTLHSMSATATPV